MDDIFKNKQLTIRALGKKRHTSNSNTWNILANVLLHSKRFSFEKRPIYERDHRVKE